MEEPTEVVAELFRRLTAHDWDAAARLFTPAYVQWFRTSQSGHHRPHVPLTVEGYLERDPNMPRVVAEYYVEQASHYPAPQLTDFFSGVATEAQLDALDDWDLYARHLAARDPSTLFAKHVRRIQERHPEHADHLSESLEQPGKWWNLRILGAVVDSEEAHVLVSRTPGGTTRGSPMSVPPAVLTLRLTGEGWRMAHELELNRHIGFGPMTVTGANGELLSLDL